MRDRQRPDTDRHAPAWMAIALVALAAGAALAMHHPVAPAAVLGAYLLWCILLAWRPGLWLFVVPAALPLLNFAPWTGWVVFEEFDLLLCGVAVGGYVRMALDGSARHETTPAASTDRIVVGLACVFGLLGVAACVHGFAMPGRVLFGWFQSYTDPLNSGRVFKSLLLAALIWPLLRREVDRAADVAVRRLVSGMLAGLTLVTLAVLWERSAYPGLWDFSNHYRTTALFWEMHVGGAAIDAYLALATPFVAWALWTARTPLRWLLAAALALLVGYACLTTFARGVYGAVLGSLVLLIPLLRWQRLPRIRWRMVAGFALAVALILEVVAVLGGGTFMRERMAASDRDMGRRLQHWRSGVGLLHSPAEWMWGLGLGRLPAAYAAAVPRRQFPGEVQFVAPHPGETSGSIRLSGPRTSSDHTGWMTLTQRVTLRPVQPLDVAFDLRSTANTQLVFQLCEMHLLYPRHCQVAWLQIQPGDATWRRAVLRLHGPMLDSGRGWAPRLGVFSVAVVNVDGAVELDNLSLVGPDRHDWLVNRDFSEEQARWYPAAQGYYVPWHIDNLYLELLIERGAFALLAFVLCLGWTLFRLVVAVGRGVRIAPFLVASLCGGLCVGLVSSVMDVPRVAFLLFFLTLFAVEVTRRHPPPDPARAGAG